jgi:hypothetical protein
MKHNESFSILNGWLSRLYYGWRMVDAVSAMRVLGGGLHGNGATVFFSTLGAVFPATWATSGDFFGRRYFTLSAAT